MAIVGAGMGGLAAAATLRRVGIGVLVYEQASQFARIGAGIQVGCNAMKVLRQLGLEARMRSQSFYPRSWNNRDWRTGDVKFDMIFGESGAKGSVRPICLRTLATCTRPWPVPCRWSASGSIAGWSGSMRPVSPTHFAASRATRKERTTRVQETSRANVRLRERTDASWVYGYDAWTAPLAA
ncbi:FAD-dependent monooxygenase [Bradyrhizobium sp.]|uniref:FAD-dependent monooxygenase n=1 Tax=Bradyrhizobium sp. TaxID=376 RepID=UPI002623454D|nr:FAD-dependent monooxygenase [Bradyrhizobium sp.]